MIRRVAAQRQGIGDEAADEGSQARGAKEVHLAEVGDEVHSAPGRKLPHLFAKHRRGIDVDLAGHLEDGEVSTGSCRPVHSIDPAAAAPLGSAFRLYVLDALGTAVASGTVRWNQLLTVTAQLKSLPSGELRDEPDGTRISVQDTAAMMISISDDTAANLLINLLGRAAVQAALTPRS